MAVTRKKSHTTNRQTRINFGQTRPHVAKESKSPSLPRSRQPTSAPPESPQICEKVDTVEWQAAEQLDITEVERYWNGVVQGSLAERIHLDGVSCAEKVLRYFDVCEKYGPCVGIARSLRWQRAKRLGLEPPLAVLAAVVLEGRDRAEDAHVDLLLNPRLDGKT